MKKIESGTPSAKNDSIIIKLDPKERQPISKDQKRLWILNKIDKNNPAYNIPFTYRLKGNLYVEVFKKSLNTIFNRHSVLRSSIKSDQDEPCAFIREYSEIPIKILDFSAFGNEVEIKIQDYFTRESRDIFDMEEGPLFRLYLVTVRNEEYIFHMTVQHMVFDGWSWGIFAGELRQIYNDLLNKRETDLTPLPYQYYDIANRQKKEVTELSFRDSIIYWKEQLKVHPSEINFPFDRTRGKLLSGSGGREAFKLNPDLSGKIRDIGHKKNTTTFMTILAAFGLLLNKYSGDDDICIGVPTANRENSANEKIIGLFVNTIILRMRFYESQSFTDLLQSTRKITIEALSHNDLPFERLVDILQPERKVNVNPITQILFAYQNTPRPSLDLQGIKAERVLIKDTVSPLDITFYAWEDNGIIEGEIEFNTDLLDRETIARLKENFVHLLEEVMESPDKKLSEISIVSDAEKKIIEEYNRTDVLIPDCLIQNLFEKQVISAPAKIAIVSGLKRLTYKELDDQANILSNHLIDLGVVQGDAVGVYVERSAEMVISVLGILKAGCCYLPLDSSFPADRLSYMFEDSGAKFIISQKSLQVNSGCFSKASFVIIEDNKILKNRYSTGKPVIKIDPEALAYIIYTSGTTGKPKGVKVHHKAVVNFINSMSKTPGMTENDTLLAVVSLSFDIAGFELFVSLSFGAKIVMARNQDIVDIASLTKMIEQHNITIIQTTPTFWGVLISGGWSGKRNLRALCGGEALTSNLVRQLFPKVKELWNMYGPTETTIWSTCVRINDPDAPINIGKPIDNTSIHILDKNNKSLPTGVIGEVAIGGSGVAKGYNNRTDLTTEKFIFFDSTQVIYKTGDQGRYLRDGNIELFGRIDNQIKIRGFRIEPSEIEIMLSKIDGIIESVVKLQKFGENDDRLVAFLNVKNTFDMEAREITGILTEKLPNYMIPAYIRIMHGFPLTINGKIDRTALKYDSDETGEISNKDDREFTDTGKKIYKIWSEVLKTKDILPDDDFFEIGGNSLLALYAHSKIESEFKIKFHLRVFFYDPRIRKLSDYIDSSVKISAESKTSIKKGNGDLKITKGEI